MDRQLIRTLIDALAASDLSELEYTSAGATLRLVRPGAAPATARPTPDPAATPIPPAATPTAEPPAAEPRAAEIAAPLYGIVHLHRSPGDPPLVAPGQPVVPGQVLCLIEAMKVFTELRADHVGTVAAILVDTGQEVEAGQPLFRLG